MLSGRSCITISLSFWTLSGVRIIVMQKCWVSCVVWCKLSSVVSKSFATKLAACRLMGFYTRGCLRRGETKNRHIERLKITLISYDITQHKNFLGTHARPPAHTHTHTRMHTHRHTHRHTHTYRPPPPSPHSHTYTHTPPPPPANNPPSNTHTCTHYQWLLVCG